MKKLTLVLAVLALLAAPAHPSLAADAAKEPIKIGEMFCYTGCADLAVTWRKGWQMALDEINNSGGVLGRPLEVLSRDDKGSPTETIKAMEELKNREGVKIFTGTLFSHTTLAASNFVKQNKLLFMRGYDGSSGPTAGQGHDLFFHFGTTTGAYSAALAERAASFHKKRWVMVVPEYEAGHTYADDFEQALKKHDPSVEFLETQWYPLGKLDAGAVTQILARQKPDAIFVFAVSGDYVRFVREGNKRKLFDNRLVVGPVAGSSNYTKPLAQEAPIGWLSGQGYPVEQISEPAHKSFIEAYTKLYGIPPDISGLHGYCVIKILAEAITQAGSDDPVKVAAILHHKTFNLPDGSVGFRADGLSTHGFWIGKTGFREGKPTILDAEYVNTDKYLPTAEENIAKRTK